jgi:hypothetical protein
MTRGRRAHSRGWRSGSCRSGARRARRAQAVNRRPTPPPMRRRSAVRERGTRRPRARAAPSPAAVGAGASPELAASRRPAVCTASPRRRWFPTPQTGPESARRQIRRPRQPNPGDRIGPPYERVAAPTLQISNRQPRRTMERQLADVGARRRPCHDEVTPISSRSDWNEASLNRIVRTQDGLR